jgi:nitrous oxidase accessory protein NosD
LELRDARNKGKLNIKLFGAEMKRTALALSLILILISLTVLCAIAIQPIKASSKIVVPDDYPIIQAAIDHADSGATILVSTGVYHQNFRIEIGKPVSLVGENKNNTIITSSYSYGAITIISTTNVLITNFTINGGNYGIDMVNVNRCIILGNNITTGIMLREYCHDNIIIGNRISGTYGVRDWGTFNNTIEANTINSWVGLSLEKASGNNTIFHNNFINCKPVSLSSWNTTWDNGHEGNYYTDYNGSDNNGDGIGDTPYTIDQSNQDRYPLMNPFDISTVILPSPSPSPLPSPSPTPTSLSTATPTPSPIASPSPEPTPSLSLSPSPSPSPQEPTPSPAPEQSEPFPTTIVITASGASVAIVSIGLLVYFKKRNNKQK